MEVGETGHVAVEASFALLASQNQVGYKSETRDEDDSNTNEGNLKMMRKFPAEARDTSQHWITPFFNFLPPRQNFSK